MEQEEREQSSFPRPVFISTIKQEIESTINIPVASNSNDPVPSTSDVPSLNCFQPKQEVSEDVSTNELSLHHRVLIKEEELSDDEINSSERLEANLDIEGNPDAMVEEQDNLYQPCSEFKGEERYQTEAAMSSSVFLKEEYTEEQPTEVPKDRKMEEISFGNHFLAEWSEPRPPGCTDNSILNGNSKVYNGPCGDGNVSYCGNGKFVPNDKANGSSLNCPNDPQQATEPQPSNNTHLVSQTHNNQYCTLCSPSVYVRSLTDHIARVHTASINCQYCSYKTPYKAVLRAHVIRRHNFGEQPIDCPYCKYASLSIMDIEYHIEVKHRKPKVYFHCNQCDYKAQCRGNLNYHVTSKHTKIKNYVCPHCDYKSIIFHNMKRHGLKVHNKKLREENCSLKNNLSVNTSLCSKN